MENLVIKLTRLLKTLRTSLLLLKFFEIVFVIGIGIATNKMTGDNNPSGWIWLTVILSLLYTLIAILQVSSLLIPETYADDLRAHFELQETKLELSRRTEIYGYVADAIGSLNEQTCNLNRTQEEIEAIQDSFCSNDLISNLSGSINPLIENSKYIFKSSHSLFTVGMYVENFLVPPSDWNNLPIDVNSCYDSGIFFLKDDLNMSDFIGKGLLTETQVNGARLKIRHSLEAAFNNCHYDYVVVEIEGAHYSIFSIGIPMVCENGDSNGVLFFITKKIDEPSDISNILKVFSKIISNLLSRQFECVFSRIETANKRYNERNAAS
ncbi:hypothetical protein [Chitinophaga pinensis]|uniref:Uncharacterized protein n=1 Tax=Chitinophaga pinensis TaxID=79329 RepID=A0A5C6LV64_9BACT|nr:hypothetical protein [Chitinophaga pinensis]TWW01093.1 hypothetical protein FEF09_09005 [Chitinophaga pinensis]